MWQLIIIALLYWAIFWLATKYPRGSEAVLKLLAGIGCAWLSLEAWMWEGALPIHLWSSEPLVHIRPGFIAVVFGVFSLRAFLSIAEYEGEK